MGTPVLQIPRGPSPTQSPDLIPSQHCVLIHLHADGVLGLCGGCAGAQVGATVPAASRGPPSPNTWQDGGQAEGCLAMFPPSSLLLQGQFCCHDLFLHGRGRPGAVDPPPAQGRATWRPQFLQEWPGGSAGCGEVCCWWSQALVLLVLYPSAAQRQGCRPRSVYSAVGILGQFPSSPSPTH